MKLPFTVLVEPPSRADFQRAMRTWWVWAAAVGLIATSAAAFVATSTWMPNETESGRATVQVASVPPAATIVVDGRASGYTPAALQLLPGEHRVKVRHDGYTEAAYHLSLDAGQVTAIEAELWLQTPLVQRLRPTFPGASIVGADFLRDGLVALTIALPPGNERQLWLVDGNGAARHAGPPVASATAAISHNGEQVAYLAAGQHTAAPGRLDEVWTAGLGGGHGERRYVLPTGTLDHRLLDLSWSPDGQRLLIVGRQQVPQGGFRTSLRLLQTGGETRELARLPSEVVPDSYSWSPDGGWVAFLAQAGQLTSLCLLSTASGEFRYLADLGRDETNPLPFAPLAWSPDGRRLLYAAHAEGPATSGGWLFGPKPTSGLFTADLERPLGQRLGTLEGQAPVWRSDGSVLALVRPSGAGPLVMRRIDPGGEFQDVAELPPRLGSTFAARWDVAHAQALIATRGSGSLGSGQPDYWLVRFRPEVGQ